jgi:hypothetical protein
MIDMEQPLWAQIERLFPTLPTLFTSPPSAPIRNRERNVGGEGATSKMNIASYPMGTGIFLQG